ncbi:MAG: serine hydrolase [Pyrinomonadaceae bacterium]
MKSEEISDFLSERIAAEDFPSAVYLVAEKGEIRFADALGLAVKTNEIEIPARIDTIYDLASLTKVLVTGLLWAKLYDEMKLRLNTSIKYQLPEFKVFDKRLTSTKELLTHTSGFAAWKPFYLLTNDQDEILSVIAAQPLESKPNILVRYSDLNFITLGYFIERVYGKKLLAIVEREILKPLKLKRTFFNPPLKFKNEIAASEFGNEYEKQICGGLGLEVENFAWRERQIWGEVHDGNAYFLGGVSGHAGLFSTAEEVFKIALQFLPSTTVLFKSKSDVCDLFKTNFTEHLNEARSLAFELAATENSTASKALSPDSFGHLGFTGTSLWIEPERERVFILLTNRTHRPLPFVNINSTRRKFHELASQLLDKS